MHTQARFLFAAQVVLSAMIAAALAPARSSASIGTDPPRIRVRLQQGLGSVSVRGFGLRFADAQPEGVTQWEFRCAYQPNGRIEASSLTQTLHLQSPLSVESLAGILSLGNRKYREKLWIHATAKGCEVVNEVDLERYLYGLVNAEFSSRWNRESVLAQVIAARTYALHRMREGNPRTRRFDVDSSTQDQVFDGVLREDFQASRLVQESAGLVLLAPQGEGLKPLKAFYHSTCGGHTELPEKVWGKSHPGFKQAVTCPFCVSSPRFSWKAELNRAEMESALVSGLIREGTKTLAALQGQRLLELKIEKRAEATGRVSELIATWGGPLRSQQVTRFSGERFRSWLGVERIRSTGFQFQETALGWNILGQGNGHGVGLCQWGAKVMGERGYSAQAILSFYYPGALIKKLW